jgi:glycosyltransferase involved in cell wall biosynthesis
MRPWRWLGRWLDVQLGFPAFFNPRWISHLHGVTNETRPVAIIVRDLPLCPTALWVGSRHRVPVVLDMAENYPAMMRRNIEAKRHGLIDFVVRNPAAVECVERYCLPRVSRVLVVVEESAARVARLGVPPQRIALVSNTPPIAHLELKAAPRVPTSAVLTIVYAGILEVPRGIDDMLEALVLLRGSTPPARAVIIGTGRDAPLFRAHASRLGLTESEVVFTGHIASHDEVRRLVAEADIGILPHRISEAWNTTIPNKLFDYMAAGLPVITSNAIPFARIVRETHSGLVFESHSPQSLAEAVRALSDPERRRACGVAGLTAVRQRYHWEYDARTLLATLREVQAPVTDGSPAIHLAGETV